MTNYRKVIQANFHIKSNVECLVKLFDEMSDRIKKLEDKLDLRKKPKKTHKDYHHHKFNVCGKTGRIAGDATCKCMLPQVPKP